MSAPTRLGRYPVRRRIGSGAFATVWLAFDEQLASPVAVKVLADNWTEDFHVRQRFLEEGRFLRKVESPHVVSVYDAGELPDGRPFLVMSYADQGSLADRLELESLTLAQAVHVVREVGAGLHALHQRGVLHRDVKPANVLFRTIEDVDGGGHVSAMLGDLGLGKAMDMSSRLTMIGGTPSYASPEQAQGEPLDARSDQYSLAALAYLLLAGRPAYEHGSLAAAADPDPPAPLGEGFGSDVDAVVARAMSADREQRYDDVPAFVTALSDALAERLASDDAEVTWDPVDTELTQRVGSSATPSQEAAARRRTRQRFVAAGAAVLVAGVAGGWAVESRLNQRVTLEDSQGQLSVTVPREWTRAVDTDQWTPPGGEGRYSALSVGSSAGWNGDDQPGEGVFVGVIPGESLPTEIPGHPECSESREVGEDTVEGDRQVTVQYVECAGGTVTVERVIQATTNRLVWVQVRAADAASANEVLRSVDIRL